MQANIHVLVLGDITDAGLGPHVKSDNDNRRRIVIRLRCRSKQNVRFGDRTDTGSDDPDLDLFRRKLLERSLENLDRALYVSLENDQKFLDLCLAERLDSTLSGLEHRRLPGVHLPLSGYRLGSVNIRHDLECITGLRHTLESKDLNRSGRSSLGHRFTAIGEHRPDLAVKLAHNERIADTHRSLLNEGRRDRTASLIKFCLEDNAGRTPGRARSKGKNVRLDQYGFEQRIEIFALFGRDRDHFRVTAPIGRLQAKTSEALFHLVRISVGFVDLVDRDNDWNARRL